MVILMEIFKQNIKQLIFMHIIYRYSA